MEKWLFGEPDMYNDLQAGSYDPTIVAQRDL